MVNSDNSEKIQGQDHQPALGKDGTNEQVESYQTISLREDQAESQPKIHAKTFLALFSICIVYFSQTYNLVGTGAQSQAVGSFFKKPGDSVWATSSLTIPSVVLSPIVAQMADYWGRKRLLVVSSLLGTAGCIVTARADSMGMFLAGTTITGIEYGVLPLLHAVPSEIIPRKWRAQAQAAVTISNASGLIVGTILSGVFGQDRPGVGFRIYYYIAAGLFALSTVGSLVAYDPPPTPLQASLSMREKLSQLDWVGYGLLATSLVLFCIGLAWSRNPYDWSDPHPSVPFAIGVALGVCLVVYETKFKFDGMFHHGLFAGKNWNFAITVLAIFCDGVAFFAATVYFSYQVELLYDADTFHAGLRFSIAFFTAIPSSVAAGLYCTLTKKVRWAAVVLFSIFVIFFVCMATADEGSNKDVWGYPVLLGWALGMTPVTLVTTAQLSTPPELITVASGLIIGVRSLGGSIGMAIYNAVLAQETQHLGERITKAATQAGLQSKYATPFVEALLSHNSSALPQIPGATSKVIDAGTQAMLRTYTSGFQHVWATAAAFVGVAAIASFFLKNPSSEFTNAIDAPVENAEQLYGSSGAKPPTAAP